MTRRFVSICPVDGDDQALSILDDPEPLWARVAVCSLWQNASTARARWPRASVVAPCRTLLGIDYLLRDLLANPQIRVLVLDGIDLSAGKLTSTTLRKLWETPEGDIASLPLDTPLLRKQEPPDKGRPLGPGDPVFEALCLLLYGTRVPGDGPGVVLLGVAQINPAAPALTMAAFHMGLGSELDCDRPGGAIVLPPPPPEAEATAPHGDPGERVTGDTLADAYVGVLRAAMRFGREVPTQYGPTRECLNLVSVIRYPELSLEEGAWATLDVVDRDMIESQGGPTLPEGATLHPVLRITGPQLHEYTYNEVGGFLGYYKAEDATYAYGQRMRGREATTLGRWARTLIDKIDDFAIACGGSMRVHLAARGLRGWLEEAEAADALPDHAPVTISGKDQIEEIKKLLGKEPGTRAAYITAWWPEEDAGLEKGRPCLVGAWFRAIPEERAEDRAVVVEREWTEGDPPFDVVMNPPRGRTLAAEFTREAAEAKAAEHNRTHRLHLTVTFRSHDLFGAYALNLGACCHWLVDVAAALGMQVGTITCVSMSGHVYQNSWEAANKLIEANKPKGLAWDKRSTWRVEVVDGSIRAVALTPDGNRTIGVFEGKTAAAVAAKIERSGLITSTGNGLWLGGELVKAEARLR